MLSFDNTQVAFQYKTDHDLNRAYLLFKTIANNGLVKTGNALVNMALKVHFPIGWAVKPTIYSHFVGGETKQECLPVIETLGRYGVKAILDFSVEGTESEQDINAALEETLSAIAFAKDRSGLPFAVFKPTAFTNERVLRKLNDGQALSTREKAEAEAFRHRVEALCAAAAKADLPILVDAEDYCFQRAIDELVEDMMAKFNREKPIVFNTLQMYRHDRLDYLKALHDKALRENFFLGIKFVRGAYMEKERARAKEGGYPSPIQPDKASTDRDYNLGLMFTLEHIDRISTFCGTHNEDSCHLLAREIERKGLRKDDPRIWFSQLYGMSDHISFNLANEGYNVAKYLPYGPVKHVMPYLLRRAQENTATAGQSSRELRLITKEKQRRRIGQ